MGLAGLSANSAYAIPTKGETFRPGVTHLTFPCAALAQPAGEPKKNSGGKGLGKLRGKELQETRIVTHRMGLAGLAANSTYAKKKTNISMPLRRTKETGDKGNSAC